MPPYAASSPRRMSRPSDIFSKSLPVQWARPIGLHGFPWLRLTWFPQSVYKCPPTDNLMLWLWHQHQIQQGSAEMLKPPDLCRDKHCHTQRAHTHIEHCSALCPVRLETSHRMADCQNLCSKIIRKMAV